MNTTMTMSNGYYEFVNFDHSESNPTITKVIFRPYTNTLYYQKHRDTLDMINELVNQLPELDYSFPENDNCDYPNLPAWLSNQTGVTYHLNRPVFIFGNVAFFRRYNDDWNSTLIYGMREEQKMFNWHRAVNPDSIPELLNIAKEKGVENVTKSEIKHILGRT